MSSSSSWGFWGGFFKDSFNSFPFLITSSICSWSSIIEFSRSALVHLLSFNLFWDFFFGVSGLFEPSSLSRCSIEIYFTFDWSFEASASSLSWSSLLFCFSSLLSVPSGSSTYSVGFPVIDSGFSGAMNGYERFFSKFKLVGKSRSISPGKGLASKFIAKGSSSLMLGCPGPWSRKLNWLFEEAKF